MFTQDHLTLQLIRVKAGEQWLNQGTGPCFIFIKGGIGKFVAGANPHHHHLSAGDLLVYNQESSAQLSVPEGGEILFWHFSLSFEHLFPLFACSEICLLQHVIDSLRVPRLYHAASPLARECHRLLAEVPPQFNLDHRTQLLRVVGAILTVEFKAAQPQRAGFIRVEDHMIQVFERLSSNELLSLSVGELAAKFSCSRRHLNRLFHQYFGSSVAALRMEMRLLKAVSLLRDPDVKVINVAEQCGFNHLGLFNTCFKRRFGSAPGQWRNQAQSVRQPISSIQKPNGLVLHYNGGGSPLAHRPGLEAVAPLPAARRKVLLNLKGNGSGEQKMVLSFHFNGTSAAGQNR